MASSIEPAVPNTIEYMILESIIALILIFILSPIGPTTKKAHAVAVAIRM